jgi:hypothetical protein
MSVGRIFDRAFAIYRNNFLRFVTIIEVPVSLLSMISRSWINSHSWIRVGTPVRQPIAVKRSSTTPDTRSGEQPPLLFGCLGTALILLLYGVAGMLCQAALIKNVSEVYLGNIIAVGQAYSFILPRSPTLVGATICVTLVTWFGFMFFFVPGVIFGLWFFLTVPAIVVEGHGALDGMSRSKALVAGNLGKVFAAGFWATVLGYIILLPLGRLGDLGGRALFGDNMMLRSFVNHFTETLSHILIVPIWASVSILLYYDLRIRKEGFDLQMLAQSMTSGQGELRAT